ncbi:hypothetical protein [Kineosporia sp. A_224]|uniref:hypothetical protein n=1 Tax=Kineosporia sp. A_224 TaxID=1962180 RepID=UPI000B4B71EA|nr:hypothetical protein [Kineosporia sp. A_224]
MRRKTFDTLLTAAGLVVAVILLVAGALLSWGSSFVNTQVHDQLVAQKIFFPPAGSEGLDAKTYPGLQQYGGQQLTTGEQAGAYADQFIAKHLEEIAGGKTYSELSTLSRANPQDTELAGQVQTMFRGETLRGLLLNAYAFGTMGKIAGIAAAVSYVGAALMFLLSILGIVHSRRTAADAVVGGVHERIEPVKA